MELDSHCENGDDRFRLFPHIVVYPKTSDAEFPWRHGIRPQELCSLFSFLTALAHCD